MRKAEFATPSFSFFCPHMPTTRSTTRTGSPSRRLSLEKSADRPVSTQFRTCWSWIRARAHICHRAMPTACVGPRRLRPRRKAGAVESPQPLIAGAAISRSAPCPVWARRSRCEWADGPRHTVSARRSSSSGCTTRSCRRVKDSRRSTTIHTTRAVSSPVLSGATSIRQPGATSTHASRPAPCTWSARCRCKSKAKRTN